MVLVSVGESAVSISINGTERVNELISSNTSYNLTESFNTTVNVNGTQEGSFTQQNDANYDVNASANPSFNRKDIITFWIGDQDGFTTASWDVFDGSGTKIDDISVSTPSGGGGDSYTKVYTNQGAVSTTQTKSSPDSGANQRAVTPTASITVDSVTQS